MIDGRLAGVLRTLVVDPAGRMVGVLMLFPVDGWRMIRHGLVEPSMAYRDAAWAEEVLRPWLDANPSIGAGLRLAGRPETASVPLAGEDLWALYAVSRLVEFLTAVFQPVV